MADNYSIVPQQNRDVEMTTPVNNKSPSNDESDGQATTAAPTAANDDVICLKPKMNLLNGITVIVGSIIGSGIFVSPKGVLENTGSVGLSLVVWIISGLFSTIGAYCYAELGCMITKTGADYAYIMESFGPFVAFLRLWIECMIVRPCSQAIVALTFSFYVLRPIFPDCDPPADAVRYLACICIGLLTFVNCWDVKWSTRVQDFFTYGKLLALCTIIITGIVQLFKGNVEYFTFKQDPLVENVDISTIALSFYSGLFAYNGWNYLNFVIEELKDPHKNLPLAIFISCSLVTIVYTMTIIAFHSTLSVADVLSAEAVAVTFAERLYGWMAWIVPVFVAMSTFGGVNGILFTSSRLFFAGAEQKQMPEILAMIQVNHLTPTPAVIGMCLLSLIYLASKDIYALINYVGFATWLAIGLGVACLPYLRWKRPDLHRPIRVNLIWPTIYILASIFITIVPMIADPKGTLTGALIILTGVPVYVIFIAWKNKPRFLQAIFDNSTLFLQKLLVVVPSEKQAKL
ncbi:Y+L amino acid transporter 2 isoform X2 [Dermatophagoides farinae]|uniref:Y+l amino acid transporter 2-like protein n=1 Tax=Dermatophagoides farinae TaxID=6954 RepID=A0A9D4SHR9_DERFA|nr:Y+L amino acid transporter 2-like isoform X1 [Dermatophagoides farinae]XP_046911056.1 Y+L amino acid transporter 2-like isoform X1 [Dermatophagoides farinae]KAH7642158.1 y+l amino acid transporter 2-like protein [Dermatophagoides farinae]